MFASASFLSVLDHQHLVPAAPALSDLGTFVSRLRARVDAPALRAPVALYPATSESEKISFNRLNRQTGHRTGKGGKVWQEAAQGVERPEGDADADRGQEAVGDGGEEADS